MIRFPELNEATLDAATVSQLFADIEQLTQVVEILTKTGPRYYAPEAPTTMSQAEQMLFGGQIRAVQIRYVHEGEQWWDTVMALPTGFRLVRLCHDRMSSSGPAVAHDQAGTLD